MKKLIILFIGLFLGIAASAQLNTWYVGGIVGFGTSSSDAALNPSTTTWAFGPEVGAFIGDSWSVGLVLGLDGSSTKNDDGDVSKSSMFMPNIYGRNWWNVGEHLNLFTGLDVAFGSGSTTTYIPAESTTEMSKFSTNLNLGIAYALAERWTLLLKVAALDFTSQKVGDITTTNFGFKADGNVTNGQFIFVGVYWTFLP